LEEEFNEYKEKSNQDLAQTKHNLNEEQTAKVAIDKVCHNSSRNLRISIMNNFPSTSLKIRDQYS
jgi:phosphoserine aminotransferase